MKKKGGEQNNAILAKQIQNEYNLYGTSPTENRLVSSERKEEIGKEVSRFFEKKKEASKRMENMQTQMTSFFDEKKKRNRNQLITKIREERNLYNSSPTFNSLSNDNKINIQSELNRLNREKKKVEEEIRIRNERLSKINKQRKICQKLKNINNQQNKAKQREAKYYPGNNYYNIAREKAVNGRSPFLQTNEPNQ